MSAGGLEGRTALVTGASRGIGRAAAAALAERGARVVIAARGASDLEGAAAEIARRGTAPQVERCDFGDARDIEALFDRIGPAGVDILVNNVGIAPLARFEDVTDEEWRRAWEVNVLSAVRCCRRALPGMAERGWGRVVNVSSSAAKRPSAKWPHYAATKAALLGLTMALADAHGRDGITVNAVCPGPVASPAWTGEGGLADEIAERKGASRDAILAEVGSGIPLGRMGEPAEIGEVIAFLCTESARYVHGAALSVDGGHVRIVV